MCINIDVISAVGCEAEANRKEKVFAGGVAFDPAHTLTFRVVKRINRKGEFREDVTSSFFSSSESKEIKCSNFL